MWKAYIFHIKIHKIYSEILSPIKVTNKGTCCHSYLIFCGQYKPVSLEERKEKYIRADKKKMTILKGEKKLCHTV